jgi:hypothetical protein
MYLVRTIVVLVIALSVAMLPTAGSAGFVLGSKAQGTAVNTPDKMPSEMPSTMDDCCPEHAKNKSKDHSSHQCPVACYAGQLVSIADTAGFRLDFPIAAVASLPIPADQVVSSRGSSPPFRPPRA